MHPDGMAAVPEIPQSLSTVHSFAQGQAEPGITMCADTTDTTAYDRMVIMPPDRTAIRCENSLAFPTVHSFE
jgi:hypothetical protein